MHTQNGGLKWNSQRTIALGHQLFDFTGSFSRQCHDRWAGATEENAEQVGVRKTKGHIQAGDQRFARWLMQTVAKCFREKRVVSDLKRLQQKEHALHVRNGVL